MILLEIPAHKLVFYIFQAGIEYYHQVSVSSTVDQVVCQKMSFRLSSKAMCLLQRCKIKIICKAPARTSLITHVELWSWSLLQ